MAFQIPRSSAKRLDVLDQFKVPSKPIPQVPTTVEDSKPRSTQEVVSPDDPALPPELSAELVAGMEEFFKELTMGQQQKAPSGPPPSAAHVPKTSKDVPESEAAKNINLPTLSEEEKKFKEIWEKMLIDGMNGEEDNASGKEFDEILRKAAPLLSKETDMDKGKGKEGAASGTPNKSGAKESVDAKLHQEAIRQTMDRLKNSDKSIKVRFYPAELV
jgi:peroxin-19